jgi:hypothetical protein
LASSRLPAGRCWSSQNTGALKEFFSNGVWRGWTPEKETFDEWWGEAVPPH